MKNGKFKLTNDFKLNDPILYGKIVRDINFTPADTRLPDVAICRVFSNRDDAEKILIGLNQ